MKVKIADLKISNRKRKADPQKVKDLADSIHRLGLLNPIIISPKKELIAGKHRVEAYNLLGLEHIEAKMKDYDDLKRDLAEIDENLVRAELSILEQSEQILQRDEILSAMNLRAKPWRNKKHAESAPLRTNVSIAAEIGIAKRTLQERKQIARDIIPEVKEKLRGTRYANSSHGLIQLAREPKHIQKAAVKKILEKEKGRTGRKPVNEPKIVLEAILAAQKEKINQNNRKIIRECQIPESIIIHHGDFRTVCNDKIPDNSVSLILTDPPYSKQELPIYKDLADMALNKLKPSGFFVALVGTMYLPTVMNYCANAGLEYHWTGVIKFMKDRNKVWNRRIWGCVRFFIMFQKPPRNYSSIKFCNDYLKSEAKEKNYFTHQKTISDAQYLISRFTVAGDTVLEPFGGVGTIPLACLKEGRKCIAIELDKKRIKVIKARIADSLSVETQLE